MNFDSSLYLARVMHDRLSPKKHRFGYRIFMFYVDLDEINSLAKKYWFISHNRFNFFSFRDKEHLQLPIENPDTSKSTKEHIVDFITNQGVQYDGGKIMLLTNFNVLGYNFNPVSFYFVFDKAEKPVCSVVEVGNTFLEMKPYFIGTKNLKENTFHLNTTKYFYVSPFIDHDTQFDFNVTIPNDQLAIGIDDYKDGERFFISTLIGDKRNLTNGRLIAYAFRFPFITIRIIVLIHWHAIKLWLKKLPFHRKSDHQEIQKEVYRRKQ